MVVMCAWCEKAGLPAFLGVKPPLGDGRATHGICPTHRREMVEQVALRHLRRDAPALVGLYETVAEEEVRP